MLSSSSLAMVRNGRASALQAPAPAGVSVSLSRGINILGADPIWMKPDQARFKSRYFADIKSAGFDFVRVNGAAMRYMSDDGRIPPQWLGTLDWVVSEATSAGLSVVIDEHDNRLCGLQRDVCRRKLRAFWTQVGLRYHAAPSSVAFEILNEPHGQMNSIWNDVVAENLKIIRVSNPNRTVIVGSRESNSPAELSNLQIPAEDQNILVSVHYYSPMAFTHQGAPWRPDYKGVTGVEWGSSSERAAIARDFGEVARWANRNRRPILLGEFGAYDGPGTDVLQRAVYLSAIVSQAEACGFSWSYWQFDSDFIAYDVSRDAWILPIEEALLSGPGMRGHQARSQVGAACGVS